VLARAHKLDEMCSEFLRTLSRTLTYLNFLDDSRYVETVKKHGLSDDFFSLFLLVHDGNEA
jgi:hypothetical protein